MRHIFARLSRNPMIFKISFHLIVFYIILKEEKWRKWLVPPYGQDFLWGRNFSSIINVDFSTWRFKLKPWKQIEFRLQCCRARTANEKQKRARHLEDPPSPFWVRAWGPQLWRAGRARARARALSTTANHGISLFFKGNPRFDQGKSCSVPRVWQLCKISARSVPVSKSYDRNEFYITFWNSPFENFGLHEAYVNRSARQRGGYFRDSS